MSSESIIDVTGLSRDEPVPVKDGRMMKGRWISLYVLYFTMFLSAVSK